MENGCRKRPVELSFAMRVLFFAQLQDVTGCAATELASPSPLNREQLWAALLEQFPGLAAHRPTVRLARNWEYPDAETLFGNGDEVAIIPPVSGG
jgi:molybdopterin synthase catalytic subunit/molybdopterin synthase sulfur carrier subunit